MKTIHKYDFKIADAVNLAMPVGAVILHVADSGLRNRLLIWAEVDTEAVLEYRTIYVRGAGHPLPEGLVLYRGTIITDPFVWHVYEPYAAGRV